MKISELTGAGSINRAMQIPVAISGENRSLSIGQIIDALAKSVIPFAEIIKTAPVEGVFSQGSPGSNFGVSIVYAAFDNRFYAMRKTYTNVSGLLARQTTFYAKFDGVENYHDDSNKPRKDCLYVMSGGRTYYYNGTNLISAGLTDEQAELLTKLTPQEVESETALQNMEAAGLIVPGQIYYIPENE